MHCQMLLRHNSSNMTGGRSCFLSTKMGQEQLDTGFFAQRILSKLQTRVSVFIVEWFTQYEVVRVCSTRSLEEGWGKILGSTGILHCHPLASRCAIEFHARCSKELCEMSRLIGLPSFFGFHSLKEHT